MNHLSHEAKSKLVKHLLSLKGKLPDKVWIELIEPLSEGVDTAFREGFLSAINHPELRDFARAVILEAQHQRERWGTLHDKNKTADDWLWVVAHLTTKAAQASRYGDMDKYKHHIITAAAVLANWHRVVADGDGSVVPEGGWQTLMDEVTSWAEKKFPHADLHTRMEVVRRESFEVEESGGKDLSEFADLLLPILHSAKATGHDVNDLLRAAWDKFDVVQKRDYGPADEHGVCHHVKAGAVAAGVAACLLATPAEAIPSSYLVTLNCDKRAEIVAPLKAAEYREQQTGLGVTSDEDAAYELWTGADGKTWTLILSLPNGMSCFISEGKDWQSSPYDKATVAP